MTKDRLTEISTSPDLDDFATVAMTKDRLTKPSTSPVCFDNSAKSLEDDDQRLNFLQDMRSMKIQQEADPEWQKDNLEWDLRTSVKMLGRVRDSEIYAQNLYAAMCNREFQRNDTWPRLTDQVWSCSWRYAGGIVADMRGEGDYMDWYCSGIRGGASYDDDIPAGLVAEGEVTDEIRADLFDLGWLVIDDAKD
jgi:hypothetical protein